MPNQIRQDQPFLGPFSNATTFLQPINNNTSTMSPYAPGDIKQSFENNDRTYTMVVVDSGATAATPTGTVAQNSLLFWKDKTNGIVTNDSRFAFLPGQPNLCAAGVSPVAVGAPGTYGSQIFMIARAYNTAIAAAATVSEGAALGVDTTASTARVTTYNSSTPPYLGVARTGVTNGVLFADFDFTTLP